MKKKIAIIGAGASGMVCAITAATNQNNHITLFDKNTKAGRKITITGNGRCNLSNRHIHSDCYYGHDRGFVGYALRQFGSREAVAFFAGLGLETVEHEDGRIFPMSLQASSVTAFLQEACTDAGVKIVLGKEITEIKRQNKGFLLLSDGQAEDFDAVVIATGSGAMPALGSSESGYRFAGGLGHRVYEPFAVLVQLVSDDPLCKRAAGVKIQADIRIRIDRQVHDRLRGDLLFTSYGLSGLAILDLSRTASEALHNGKRVDVVVDMLPDISLSALKNILQKKAKQFIHKKPQHWLNGILHQKLVTILLLRTGLHKSKTLHTKAIQQLAYEIKNFTFSVHATRGLKGAEVMAGGIDTAEVNPKSMMSRLQEGLYFCGEVLDIDGKRGGYNLHWAWASGYLAGRDLAV